MARTAIDRMIFGRRTATPQVAAIPWKSPVLIGRVFLSIIFLGAAFGKLTGWEGTVEMMQGKGITPAEPLLALAVAAEIIGGASILLGAFARVGAVILMVFLVAVTPLFHDFWALEGAERQTQMEHFLKNLAIFGGLLLVLGFGPGRCSVDHKLGPDEGGVATHEEGT